MVAVIFFSFLRLKVALIIRLDQIVCIYFSESRKVRAEKALGQNAHPLVHHRLHRQTDKIYFASTATIGYVLFVSQIALLALR